jgi:hypothetical protein
LAESAAIRAAPASAKDPVLDPSKDAEDLPRSAFLFGHFQRDLATKHFCGRLEPLLSLFFIADDPGSGFQELLGIALDLQVNHLHR